MAAFIPGESPPEVMTATFLINFFIFFLKTHKNNNKKAHSDTNSEDLNEIDCESLILKISWPLNKQTLKTRELI